MHRRQLLKSAAAGAALSMATCAKAEGQGVFRLEKSAKRWVFRTPADDPFLMLAVNHSHNVNQPRNNPLIERMFANVADRDGHLAEQIRDMGFNAAGIPVHPPLMAHLPFTHGTHFTLNSYWLGDQFQYDDVFDSDFHRSIDEKVRQCCAEASSNPNLIGFCWTDTPRWDLDIARETRGTDWVSAIRSLQRGSPGKLKYIEFLQAVYDGDLEAMKRDYRVNVSAWDALMDEQFVGVPIEDPVVRKLDEEFLRLIARELFGVIAGAFQRHDGSRHLQLGERYLLHDHPPAVLEEALPYIDALCVQAGVGMRQQPFVTDDHPFDEAAFDGVLFDRLHERTGKPIIIVDHNISFPAADYQQTTWLQKPTWQEAAAAYERFVRDAFSRPYIVGYGKCELASWVLPNMKDLLRQGMLTPDGTPYTGYSEAIAAMNRKILSDSLSGIL